MRQHHKATSSATSSATSKAAWALIHKGANGVGFVVASSSAVSADVDDIGADVIALGLPMPPHTGFWFWEGRSCFDGLDDVWLESELPLQLLNYRGAAIRISMHENYSG